MALLACSASASRAFKRLGLLSRMPTKSKQKARGRRFFVFSSGGHVLSFISFPGIVNRDSWHTEVTVGCKVKGKIQRGCDAALCLFLRMYYELKYDWVKKLNPLDSD